MTPTGAPHIPIGGTTRLIPIIGDPIGQVRSPEIFNPRLAAARIDVVVVPVHVLPDRFDETVRGLMAIGNLAGIIVTVPYKARVLDLVERRLPTAELVGAANALRRDPDGRWSADMFDGHGLVRGLRERDISLAGLRVLLVGAGGAGSAVAAAFAGAGVAALRIVDTAHGRAEALAERVATAFPQTDVNAGAPDPDRVDVVVNATPLGMAPADPLPVDATQLSRCHLVVDIVMKPETTKLMAAAAERGCRVVGGRAMLEGQVSELLDFFRVSPQSKRTME